MAIYRERRRIPGWAWAAGMVVLIVAGGIAIVAMLALSRPSEPERLDRSVQEMTTRLDVLRLSLYTDEVVRDGQVLFGGEYQAALETIDAVRTEWDDIGSIPAAQASSAIEADLATLDSMVRGYRPAGEVSELVARLIVSLDRLEPEQR